MKINYSDNDLKRKAQAYKQRTTFLYDVMIENFSYLEPYVQQGMGIISFNNLLHNKLPGVVVGLGPSLDNHLDLLRAYQDDVLIIATDATVPILAKNGIVPHAVAICDHSTRQIVNFEGQDVKQSLVFAASVINPMTFQAMRKADARVIWYNMAGDDSITSAILKIGGKKGALLPGVLTSACAYQMGIWLGLRRMAFIGSDLAYLDINKGYADNTSEEKVNFQINTKYKDGLALFPDIHGNSVLTSDVFIAFYDWMNVSDEKWKWHGVSTYNCSECGILHGPRIKQMPFSEFLQQFSLENSAIEAMEVLNKKYQQEMMPGDYLIDEVPLEENPDFQGEMLSEKE